MIALGFSSADVQVEDISLDDSNCSLFLANLGIITSSPYAFGSNLWTGVSDLPYYVTVHEDFFQELQNKVQVPGDAFTPLQIAPR